MNMFLKALALTAVLGTGLQAADTGSGGASSSDFDTAGRLTTLMLVQKVLTLAPGLADKMQIKAAEIYGESNPKVCSMLESFFSIVRSFDRFGEIIATSSSWAEMREHAPMLDGSWKALTFLLTLIKGVSKDAAEQVPAAIITFLQNPSKETMPLVMPAITEITDDMWTALKSDLTSVRGIYIGMVAALKMVPPSDDMLKLQQSIVFAASALLINHGVMPSWASIMALSSEDPTDMVAKLAEIGLPGIPNGLTILMGDDGVSHAIGFDVMFDSAASALLEDEEKQGFFVELVLSQIVKLIA